MNAVALVWLLVGIGIKQVGEVGLDEFDTKKMFSSRCSQARDCEWTCLCSFPICFGELLREGASKMQFLVAVGCPWPPSPCPVFLHLIFPDSIRWLGGWTAAHDTGREGARQGESSRHDFLLFCFFSRTGQEQGDRERWPNTGTQIKEGAERSEKGKELVAFITGGNCLCCRVVTVSCTAYIY